MSAHVDDISPRAYLATLASVAVLALILRLPGLAAPFADDGAGWTGAFYATIARNMLRLGSADLVMNAHASAADAVSYAHHPPLVEWAIVASTWLFGDSEAAARIPFLLASLLAVLVVARVCRRENDSRIAGAVGALMLATCPVSAIYGHQVEVVGSLLVLAMLCTVAAYLGYREHGGRRAATWLALWAAVCVLADWPGLLLVAAIAAHAVLVRPRVPTAALAAGTAGLTTLVTVTLWLLSIASGDGWASLVERVWHRTFSFTSDAGRTFDLFDVAHGYLRHHGSLIGPSLLALAVVWGTTAIARRRLPGPASFSFVLFCVVFLLVCVQSINQHEFWLHATAPAYAIVAASLLATWRTRRATVFAVAALCALVSVGVTANTRARRQHSPTGPPAAAHHHELAGWVAARVPEDEIVAVVDDSRWPTLDYYLDRKLVEIDSLAALPAEPVQHAQWLTIPAPAPPAWLLVRGENVPAMTQTLVERRGGYSLYRLHRDS